MRSFLMGGGYRVWERQAREGWRFQPLRRGACRVAGVDRLVFMGDRVEIWGSRLH